MKQVAIRIRDWWRGFSDDDLRFVYEIVAHAAERGLTDAQVAALRSCPEYRNNKPHKIAWGTSPEAAR